MPNANVLFIVLHDTTSGIWAAMADPIAPSNLDGIAAEGRGYKNMHTTALVLARLVRASENGNWATDCPVASTVVRTSPS